MVRLNKQSIENLKAAESVMIIQVDHRGESYFNVSCTKGSREVFLYSSKDIMLYSSIDAALKDVQRHITNICETVSVMGYTEMEA